MSHDRLIAFPKFILRNSPKEFTTSTPKCPIQTNHNVHLRDGEEGDSYMKDGCTRRKCCKEPPRLTKMLFCRRGLNFFNPLELPSSRGRNAGSWNDWKSSPRHTKVDNLQPRALQYPAGWGEYRLLTITSLCYCYSASPVKLQSKTGKTVKFIDEWHFIFHSFINF